MADDDDPPERRDVPITVELGATSQDRTDDSSRTEPLEATAEAVGKGLPTGMASSSNNPANSTLPTNTGAKSKVPTGGVDQTYAEASRSSARHGDATPAQEDRNGDKVQRPYLQQVEEAIRNRNIIEINLQEMNGRGNSTPLSETDIAVIFFDMLHIRPEDATRIATRTSSFLTREIELKPGVNATNHLHGGEHFTYKREWRIHATTQCVRYTRVTFRDVPLNVEDEEIVHLCSFFGEVRKKTVMKEEAGAVTRGVRKSTRYVDMRFKYGAYLNNFYWMEGPLEGDKPARIKVSHPQQPQQCSHCLQQPRMTPTGQGCTEGAYGAACKDAGGRRADIEEYSQHLYMRHGYISLKRAHLFRNTQVQGGATRRNDGFVSQLNNQKKTGNRNQKKKKPTPPVQTQDIRETGGDGPPPYDPSADIGPEEISLNREPRIPDLPHLPPRTPASGNNGTAPQTAGSTNPIQDSALTGNESSTLAPPNNSLHTENNSNPHTDPTNPSNNTPEHRQEGGDRQTNTDPTTRQGEDNSNLTPETSSIGPPPTHATTPTPATLTDHNQQPTQSHTPAGAASQIPAAAMPHHTPEEPTTPTVETPPVVPSHTLSTVPPSWDEEMAEELDRTPELESDIPSRLEAAHRIPEEPVHPTQRLPEEPGQVSQEQPAVPEHPPHDNQDTPQHQIPVTSIATSQQQTPITPLATVRPFTHNPQESAPPPTVPTPLANTQDPNQANTPPPTANSNQDQLSTPPPNTNAHLPTTSSPLSPTISNQTLDPRSLAQTSTQDPSQTHSQATPLDQQPQTYPQGTNGNLTELPPSPDRPAQPHEPEDDDPYQIMIVAKEEPGDSTVIEEGEGATGLDDSRGQGQAEGQDPLQEDAQALSQNLLAEDDDGDTEDPATQDPREPFYTPEHQRRPSDLDRFERDFPPLDHRFDLNAEASRIPDDVWEWDAVAETMQILDTVRWEVIIGRLCPNGGYSRQRSLGRAIVQARARQIQSDTRPGVRPRSSPGAESENQRSKRDDSDSEPSL